jgi:hypothetical protein
MPVDHDCIRVSGSLRYSVTGVGPYRQYCSHGNRFDDMIIVTMTARKAFGSVPSARQTQFAGQAGYG